MWKSLKSGQLPKGVQFGDTVALHVSSTEHEDYDLEGVLTSAGLPGPDLPPLAYLRGAIIGTFVIRGVVRTDDKGTILDGTEGKPFPHFFMRVEDYAMFVAGTGLDPDPLQLEQFRRWWLGPYAFWLDDVMVFPEPVMPVSGALNFWEVPDDDTPNSLLKRVRAQQAVATPAERPDWYRQSLAKASAHDTILKMIEVDPTMPPDTIEIRSGDQKVTLTDVKMGPGKPGQMDLFAPVPSKSGRLH